jgi:hypothetical protein
MDMRDRRDMHGRMTARGKRAAATILALSAADVGLWASVAPRSFFRSFPGAGHHWAVLRPQPEILRLAGVAWLVFSIPHLAYHAAHLDRYGLADQIGNVVALGGTVVLAMVLLLPGTRREA